METKKRTITPEKKEEYRRKRKETDRNKFERWKKEKDTPAIESRRMSFVRNIILSKGMTLKDVADRSGLPLSAVAYIINYQDDCFVSQVRKLLKAAGIDTEIQMKRKTGEGQPAGKPENTLPFRFTGNISMMAETAGVKVPEYVRNCTPDRNLHFLARFIIDYRKPITEFCEGVGLCRSSLISFFKRDDIKLSTLCSVAEKAGAEIIWNLNDESVGNDKNANEIIEG